MAYFVDLDLDAGQGVPGRPAWPPGPRRPSRPRRACSPQPVALGHLGLPDGHPRPGGEVHLLPVLEDPAGLLQGGVDWRRARCSGFSGRMARTIRWTRVPASQYRTHARIATPPPQTRPPPLAFAARHPIRVVAIAQSSTLARLPALPNPDAAEYPCASAPALLRPSAAALQWPTTSSLLPHHSALGAAGPARSNTVRLCRE